MSTIVIPHRREHYKEVKKKFDLVHCYFASNLEFLPYDYVEQNPYLDGYIVVDKSHKKDLGSPLYALIYFEFEQEFDHTKCDYCKMIEESFIDSEKRVRAMDLL